jgi:hypothetical protein
MPPRGAPTLVGIIEQLWLQIGPHFNLFHGSGNFATAKPRQAHDGIAARDTLRADIDDAYGVLLGC